MKVAIFSSILLLVIFTGCSDSNVNPSTEVHGLNLFLEETSFNINEPIVSTLSNQTILSAFLYHCNYIFRPDIEKKENDSWVHYYSPVCPAVYLSGVTVFEASKEIKVTSFINKPGIYRLKYFYSFSNIDYPNKSLYSKEFFVE